MTHSQLTQDQSMTYLVPQCLHDGPEEYPELGLSAGCSRPNQHFYLGVRPSGGFAISARHADLSLSGGEAVCSCTMLTTCCDTVGVLRAPHADI